MRTITGLLAGAMLLATAGAASATVVLDFEGVGNNYPFPDAVDIAGFYNGGTSGIGTSGIDHGVSFDNAAALCLNTDTQVCSNSSRGGLAPASATGAMVLAQDGEAILNYAAGFDTALSFFYTQPDQSQAAAAIYVYEGLGGSGNLLGFLDLAYTAATCDSVYSATYCPFDAASISFAGIARSVVFEGTADYTVFDDLTFGSATPGNGGNEGNGGNGDPVPGIPEPATWAMLLFGFGLVGLSARRRREHPMHG